MKEFFADYGGLIAPIAAIVNGFIAVLVAQFFKDNTKAKIILVIGCWSPRCCSDRCIDLESAPSSDHQNCRARKKQTKTRGAWIVYS
jgi:hypothetical protein